MKTRQQMHDDHETKSARIKKEIRELMELKGWTQAELATEINVAASTAWRWYEGIAIPIPFFQSILRRWLDEARANPARQTA